MRSRLRTFERFESRHLLNADLRALAAQFPHRESIVTPDGATEVARLRNLPIAILEVEPGFFSTG